MNVFLNLISFNCVVISNFSNLDNCSEKPQWGGNNKVCMYVCRRRKILKGSQHTANRNTIPTAIIRKLRSVFVKRVSIVPEESSVT